MKILVATSDKQGERENDFFNCQEGEPVVFPVPCDCDEGDIDGSCGCRRCMIGMITGNATTTVKMIDDPAYTIESFKTLYDKYMSRSGWVEFFADEYEDLANEEIEILLQAAQEIPVGTVFEIRGEIFQSRDDKD